MKQSRGRETWRLLTCTGRLPCLYALSASRQGVDGAFGVKTKAAQAVLPRRAGASRPERGASVLAPLSSPLCSAPFAPQGEDSLTGRRMVRFASGTPVGVTARRNDRWGVLWPLNSAASAVGILASRYRCEYGLAILEWAGRTDAGQEVSLISAGAGLQLQRYYAQGFLLRG